MHTVITGANRGIGQGLAQGYEDLGHQVTKTSRTPREGFATLDVADPAAHLAFAASLDGAPIDLLIVNAGVNFDKSYETMSQYTPQQWAETFAINVTGAFLTVQSLLANIRAADKAKIAIVSSQLASSTNSGKGMLMYRASKAAVLNLGRNLAVEFEPEGIAVGIYHPGWVQTDMGGANADIDIPTSAKGLIQRFDLLSMATTGVYEDYKGDALPY